MLKCIPVPVFYRKGTFCIMDSLRKYGLSAALQSSEPVENKAGLPSIYHWFKVWYFIMGLSGALWAQWGAGEREGASGCRGSPSRIPASTPLLTSCFFSLPQLSTSLFPTFPPLGFIYFIFNRRISFKIFIKVGFLSF